MGFSGRGPLNCSIMNPISQFSCQAVCVGVLVLSRQTSYYNSPPLRDLPFERALSMAPKVAAGLLGPGSNLRLVAICHIFSR